MAYDPNERELSRLNDNEREIAPAPQAPALTTNFGMTPAIAREIARVQGMILSAQLRPRNLREVWNRVEGECSRKDLAMDAIYQYARGGTDISGPSIRLAEALIRCYGNADAGFETISADSESTKVRAYAVDYESNTTLERVFDVSHFRNTKKGRTRLTDDRDIYETVANNAQRRTRACILSILPGDLVDFAVRCCRKTLEKNVDLTPEKIRGLVEAFSKYGVSQVMIEAKIQRHIETMTPAHYANLVTIGNSLRDGVATVDDFFDKDAKPLGTAAIAESEKPQLAKAPARKPAAAKAQHRAEPEPETVQASATVAEETTPTASYEMSEDDFEGASAAFDAAGPEGFQDDYMGDFFDKA